MKGCVRVEDCGCKGVLGWRTGCKGVLGWRTVDLRVDVRVC